MKFVTRLIGLVRRRDDPPMDKLQETHLMVVDVVRRALEHLAEAQVARNRGPGRLLPEDIDTAVRLVEADLLMIRRWRPRR